MALKVNQGSKSKQRKEGVGWTEGGRKWRREVGGGGKGNGRWDEGVKL